MAGLMDAIQQQLSTPQASIQQPQMGQTEQAGGLLRTKLTGKQTTDAAAPAQSNLGEALAQQQTQAGEQHIAQEGKIEASQLGESQADIQQRQSQQQQQHQSKMAELNQNYTQKATGILDDLSSAGNQLDTNQKLAKMEQAGFLIRHTNENYVQELKRQGDLNRLSNTQDFREASARSIMEEQIKLFKDDAQFKAAMNMSDREFKQQLSNMSEDWAAKLADMAFQQEAKKAMVEGISSSTSAAGKAYEQYTKDNPEPVG